MIEFQKNVGGIYYILFLFYFTLEKQMNYFRDSNSATYVVGVRLFDLT